MNCKGKLSGLIVRLRDYMPDYNISLYDNNTILAINKNNPDKILKIQTYETPRFLENQERDFRMKISFPNDTYKIIKFSPTFDYISEL